MADAELAKALKDLPNRVQTASKKERREVLQNVVNVLSNPGINEKIVNGVCKVLSLTLHRYKDSASQSYVRNLIVELLKKQPDATVKHMTAVVTEQATWHKNVVATLNTSLTAYIALKWSTLVILHGYNEEMDTTQILPKLIEAQANLSAAAVASNDERLSNKVYTLLAHEWTTIKNIEIIYVENLTKLEIGNGTIILASLLTKYLVASKRNDLVEQLKVNMIDIFIKVTISCKKKPDLYVVDVAVPLLRRLTHEEFKIHLLPALQKAMLRNPEIIIESVGHILNGLSLDLSQYCQEISKGLFANLHSKEDLVRDNAVGACRKLALQCSDTTALESLLSSVFAVFHGSEGKLTVATHKISVLQGAGNLSYNAASGSSVQKLAETACEHFVKVLETEVHEKTLIHALEMMALWSKKFSSNVPKSVVDAFKKGMAAKTSTAAVRTAYIKLFFSTPATSYAGVIAPTLAQAISRAMQQCAQPTAVTEGLVASYLLLKFVLADQVENDKQSVLWSAIDEQIFFSEKFLSTCGDDILYHLMLLCERLISEFSDRLNEKALNGVHRAIVSCATAPNSSTRQRCFPLVKKVVTGLSTYAPAQALLTEFNKFLENVKIKSEADKESRDESSMGEITGRCLADGLFALCSGSFLFDVPAMQMTRDSLLPSHHPALLKAVPNLWFKIAKNYSFIPKDFLRSYSSEVRKMLIQNYRPLANYENALIKVVSLAPDAFLPALVSNVISKLDDPEILRVTKDEYFTYLTPEGELYDKSVLPVNDENDILNSMNMKRESKVYSFKEQQEELQLRRELYEKRKREGKIKEPKLTPKQEETLKAQIAKENGIRKRLTELKAKIDTAVSLVTCSIRGNRQELSLHLKDLLPSILKNLGSPLAAPEMAELYLSLRQTVTIDNSAILGDLIAHVTLRQLQPQCDLDPAWEEENLDVAVKRTLNLIHTVTIKKKELFTASAFCYVFPFVRKTLLTYKDDGMIVQGLQFIQEHTKQRGSTNELKDPRHPRLLPRKQMFDLLIELMEKTTGRVQSHAVATLLDVAHSGSGQPNTAIATSEDIDSLIGALQNSLSTVRDAALRGLAVIRQAFPSHKEDEDQLDRLTRRVWIARFDVSDENKILANELWDAAELTARAEVLCDELIQDIAHPVEPVQQAAAYALAQCLATVPHLTPSVLDNLLQLYQEKLAMIPPKLNDFGRVIEQPIDTWGPRRGVALALAQIAPLLTADTIHRLVQFFVSTGLGDRNQSVRTEMLTAAVAAVDLHGKVNVTSLLPVFEDFMDKAPKIGSFDSIKQSVVILMGSLARHLDKDDPRIKPIVMRLIAALSTPSQQVQEAVANCLPHLVPSIKEDAPKIVDNLMDQLLKSDKYGERKGAAYGLAGIIKGMGILALKQLDIMTTLTNAIQDKKNYRHREGALFAFEMLCTMLGRLFEPYIVHVLPHLLLCFGDSSQYVRAATDDTARVVMSKLSAHGVKLVLPSLLAALEEDSWRTKTGSVELLGAMAYCAPKQLSSCLPSIVPKLIEVLSDSHTKVQEAGAEALKVIGSVIRNPEIQAIVPVLLKALQDPSHKTATCLQTLLDTQFVHFIDAPSLALIMPVVQRAFLDRSTETRKMAAQIIGNMYSLTDQKDLTPYLPTIIPGLKTSLLDPVPEVRSVSARALGAMVRGMGESSFEDLLPWLMQTLTSESSSVDRSGAAQGLSEVVRGLGVEKLHKLMPEIISTAERTDIAPHVKDGYIMMFIYMPSAFTTEFTPYIGQIINPILKALADENEYVRETALRAGQRIVTLYADSAIMLLLPELEKGLFDDNWRIRYSSVQLLGDLLYRISGVSGKMSTETASEDDNFGTEQSHYAIINALGAERRNRVLAGLYMGRSDVALMVRQAALHVWKVVVTNTPRTLREILPTLFTLLLGCLASTSYDKRQVAARTLGDLVRKLGERVLPEIIPILEKGLQSDQADQRQGVCIGLSEIMASTNKDMVLTFVISLVPTVRKALCDPLPEVRQAAAKTFDGLHSTVGVRALDDILPAMLTQLNSPDSAEAENTLDGLRQVMAIKSRVVLPYLVPQLASPPVNTKALSILASVAGEALTRFLHRILPALLTALSSAQGTANELQELEYCQAVVLSVTDEVGVRTVMDQLMEATRAEDLSKRRSAATLLCAFCRDTRADYSQYVPQLLRGLIHLFTDEDKDVLQMSWEALTAVTKTLSSEQQIAHVQDIRQAVRFAVSDLKGQELLPGFCLPKGITPILPIFREAILNGLPEAKEHAAQGLGEVIRLSSASALQPSVVQITGPLIRILGDRFNWSVKAAVLETLAILLGKVGVMLKQFLPQLQTTFLRALNDSNRQVRLKAAYALSNLIVIHTRVDPLFTELHTGIKTGDDPAIRETMLQALRGVLTPAGDKMTDPMKKQVFATLSSMLSHPEDVTRNAVAGCFGALLRWLSPEQLAITFNDHLLCNDVNADWMLRHGRSAALFVTLKESPATVYNPKEKDRVCTVILSYLAADRVQIVMNGVRACGYLFQYLMNEAQPVPQQILSPFVRSMNNNSNDVKQLLARVCIHLARNILPEKMSPELLRALLPMLVNGTKEKNGYVKANSELALIAVLRLRQGEEEHQRCMAFLDAGARESLSDVVSKVLRKVLSQPEGKIEELDDTLLT
ncbi:eIF-2-alpha kinase activator GCN1 [Harpegnathos saltator]|uniref:eIF-2-alpha kinase activator GCN1 n=1 Tax=Harpegnathos saltator TaxID=610380 RepID=UPI00058D8679|nr:eIF-2-alpha kinase activator GCN1 [Harpegnathos saltator]XP_019699556.1 eIF-2-alpha kinase activator GCN1 [Harpegnathos saltator]